MSTAVFDWGKYARYYDSILALLPYRQMLEEVTEASKKIGDGKILDASCGTGNFVDFRMSPLCEIIGIDSSPSMLGRAIEKCTQVLNCSFVFANLDKKLPFSDNSFDQVVSLNTLYAVDKPEETLREFFRVLKPGGHLLLVNPDSGFENGLILKAHSGSSKPDEYWLDAHSSPEREEFLLREALGEDPALSDMIKVAAYNREIAKNAHFHFLTESEMNKLLSTTGFLLVKHSWTYANQDLFFIARK